jgi:2,5-dihydroxypyridine 5,6-dioxygenase
MLSNKYPEIIESAKQAGIIANVKPGEKVALLADRGVENGVLYALWGAMQARGAEVYLFQVEHPTVWYVPPAIKSAIAEMDVVFHSWPAAEGPDAKKMRRDKGSRWIYFGDCRTMDKFLGESVRFPIDLLSAIIRNTWARIDYGKDVAVRITDPKGTDLSLCLNAQEVKIMGQKKFWQGRLIADEAGDRSTVPLTHGPNILLSSMVLSRRTAQGILVYDAVAGLPGAYSGGFGDAAFRLPLTIHVKDGMATQIEGGTEARFVNQVLEGMGRELTEIGLGFNPKYPTAGGHDTGMAGSNHSGTMHVAFGHTGVGVAGSEHVDGCLFQGTLTVDGEVVIDAGRLVALDDPEVRDLAAKYGDPAHVLMELV